jgi:insulysin
MLFLGSEKFPTTDAFSRLVSKYGGRSNAYTSQVKTNYYFNVQNQGVLDVLDVFANFFVSPLLVEESIQREVNAVDSEYQIDVAEDAWKLFHILTLLTREEHPLSQFSIGNRGTLLKPGIQKALRDFFQTYYSSNLMALVVKSSMDLQSMEEWIRSSDFTKIVNRNLKVPEYPILPLMNLPAVAKYHLNSK